MTNAIKNFMLFLVRFAVVWLVDALSLMATAWLLPGITITSQEGTSPFLIAISAALVLSIVNLLIRPAILLIARPLGWVALFVVGFLVNSIALWITAWLLPGFNVDFFGGLLGGLVFAIFNAILTGILELNDEGSFYQNRMERRAKEQPFDSAGEPGVGLMLLEIDGLSYWHIQKAIDAGIMPTMKKMIEEDGYVLSKVDCGLPSMTSACQAGIMFGDNSDIPAYRWYDKDKQKLYVSNSDATELNGRYAHGQGLMRRGSSIMNMLNGDAEKSMFTMANMFTASPEESKRRAEDVAMLMLDPYFLMRGLVMFFWEVLRELWEAYKQKQKNVQPRLNRMEHWYPMVRGAMCSLTRDLCANVAIFDMMRGAASIYMLYLGYDEVAHHSGPWTDDAFGDLKRLDKTFERLRNVVKNKAPRPYDFIILSDHGQSFGATFKQRYGLSIKEFIEQQLPAGVSVAQSIGGDTGAVGLQGMAGELANVHQSGASNALGNAVARQGQKLATKGAESGGADMAEKPASVTAYGSGNAAQVYFDLFPRKIKLSELEAAYPGMVDKLVAHEGLGIVAGYADDMTPVVIGKGGRRNLATGAVEGQDPVLPYAPAQGHGAASVDKRVWQLKRVMDFPHAGDLWLISTVYPDGTVAALEELIGSHGGVGGEQTDAFIFHPPSLEVPETRNSSDVFHILNGHRNAPVVERPKPVVAQVPDWSPSTLFTGIARVGAWVSLAMRCIAFDRSAYKTVVDDPYMTGPAVLIMLLASLLTSVAHLHAFDFRQFLGEFGLSVLSAVVVFAAGWLLSRQGTFTRTFRAMGFSYAVYLILILALIPGFSPGVLLAAMALGFLTWWMAGATAHQLSGWRALVLPAMAWLVVTLGTVLILALVAGTQYTIQSIFQR